MVSTEVTDSQQQPFLVVIHLKEMSLKLVLDLVLIHFFHMVYITPCGKRRSGRNLLQESLRIVEASIDWSSWIYSRDSALGRVWCSG